MTEDKVKITVEIPRSELPFPKTVDMLSGMTEDDIREGLSELLEKHPARFRFIDLVVRNLCHKKMGLLPFNIRF